MGNPAALEQLWEGWQVVFWGDRFERQVRRCQGGLRIPPVDLIAGVDSVQDLIRRRLFDAAGEPGTRPTSAQRARFESVCAAIGGSVAESA